MDDDDRRHLIDQLALVPVFAHLTRDALEGLARLATPREYAAGEVVFLEGDPPAGLFVVDSGRIKVVKTSPQGREHILDLLAPGQPANAVGVFADRPNPATAVALEAARVWLIPRQSALALLRSDPEFAQRIIEDMATHMVHLVELVADLSLRSVLQRLAKLLLAEAEGDVLVRPRWFTHPELAARLGTVPDVVQRALARLGGDGLVEVDRREIRILDRAALERLAD